MIDPTSATRFLQEQISLIAVALLSTLAAAASFTSLFTGDARPWFAEEPADPRAARVGS